MKRWESALALVVAVGVSLTVLGYSIGRLTWMVTLLP
jgi:hypothetical protein